ncbi:hypothetical protein [Parachlamydia sp. AcF125]|uniref:MORN repeat-containing protein n=1 Tax=Parachlamydia sp. AcF125 TaxID=2795736 RepID=UPI001BC97A5B|nr:hypothetical protein [Parachlamydia sp. AcF125]MBS4168205.1 hypothetical protein [Parachlamydia sp. AcF125]
MSILPIEFLGLATAEKIIHPERSLGKLHNRIVFQGLNNSRYFIRIHSKLIISNAPPKLNFFERRRIVLLKVKDPLGQEGYLKVNANSLRKRFSIAKRAFCYQKKMDKLDLTSTIVEQIQAIQKGNLKAGFSTTKRLFSKEIYIGHKQNGLYEGYGILKLPGLRYEGRFHKDYIAEGILTYSSGDKFEGKFSLGKLDEGTFSYQDGTRYKGQYFEGAYHGLGTRTYSCGSRYKGAWAKGKRDGKGIYTFANGKLLAAHWKDDIIVEERDLFEIQAALKGRKRYLQRLAAMKQVPPQ